MDQTLQLVFSDDPEAFIAERPPAWTRSPLPSASFWPAALPPRKVPIEARRELQANQTAAAQQLGPVVEAQRKALAVEKADSREEPAGRPRRGCSTGLRPRSGRRSSRGGVLRVTTSVPAQGRAAAAVQYALAQVGDAYVYGAAGPSAFDCSGLTMMAWAQAGVSLPHSSSAQYGSGAHISESQLQPGDLVFYYSPISHVAMYIGNGMIVHAANPGVGVLVSPLHYMPYAGAVRPG